MWLKSIFVLCFDVARADLNGIEFIGTDSAMDEFLQPGFCVKKAWEQTKVAISRLPVWR